VQLVPAMPAGHGHFSETLPRPQDIADPPAGRARFDPDTFTEALFA